MNEQPEEELQKVPLAIARCSGKEMKASHLEGGLKKEDEGNLYTVKVFMIILRTKGTVGRGWFK